jgi:cobalt-zinc-cadmium efflux system outer membrane protein
MRRAWLMCCAIGLSPAAHAQDLSYSDALAQAGADGPSIEASASRVEAARLERRAAGRLPDPQLVLGYQNIPVDGPDAYRLDRDFMTMQSVGIMQDMPSGFERRARRAIADSETMRAEAALDVATLEARFGAAQAWINLYYAERRVSVLERMAGEARALAAAARARLGGGAGSIDDAIAAEIEAARIEDRRADLATALIGARAQLRRWLGDAADQPLAAQAPAFAIDPAELRARLQRHPELASFEAQEAVAAANLRLARAERAPDWSWSLMYQRRAPELSDMASVEVRIGLPLFQAWRQGPLIQARQADARRVEAERSAAEREYAAMLDRQLADYASTSVNLARAQETRLPLAQRRADAAQGAFASGTASSDQLIAARRGALEAELDVLDLQERLASLGAALTLQYGEADQ